MKFKNGSVAGAVAVCGLVGLGAGLLHNLRTRQERTRLAGKVVLITGGSRGLGFALARELAFLGARLALTSRNQDELDSAKNRLVQECEIPTENIYTRSCDVGSYQQVEDLLAGVTAYFGKVDIVINNAGVIVVGPVESHGLAEYEETMRINFFGALHTALAILPQMVARASGSIVNIASVGGKVAFPHLLPYVASKYALVGWSQGLRTELAPKGVRVTTVCPGVMRTGAHIQAKFSGDAEKEYGWFAPAASFPGTAVDASVAARKIINGMVNDYAEISIGLQALTASRLSNLAPELTSTMLQMVNHLLPSAPEKPEGNGAARAVPGKSFRHSLPRVVSWFGEAAIRRYNQDADAV